MKLVGVPAIALAGQSRSDTQASPAIEAGIAFESVPTPGEGLLGFGFSLVFLCDFRGKTNTLPPPTQAQPTKSLLTHKFEL